MPASQMTACRGGCGRDIYVSQSSSPTGPVCRECRSAPSKVCLFCARPFKSRGACCSMSCAQRFRQRSVASDAA